MDVNYNMQSGASIPLADIIEFGDNYVKFSNGIMIAYGIDRQVLSSDLDANTAINSWIKYSIAFSSPPAISIIPAKSDDGTYDKYFNNALYQVMLWSLHQNITLKSALSLSDCIIVCITNDIALKKDAAIYLSYIAIGRWK